MHLGSLFERAGLEYPAYLADREISGIVTDHRMVIKDCIFVCIRGAKYDTHVHISEAIEAGAAVIVAERVRDACVGGAATIFVENTRHATSLLYSAWYDSPTSHLKVIGVTGTNGKTSVCLMLKRIFEEAGYPCGYIGTVGCFSVSDRVLAETGMTTPDAEQLYSALAEMRNDGAEYVFIEVSSHALAQCRVDAIEFDTAVFTNLTEDHLDFHKNMETYYKAKEKLFFMSRRAVINIDDRSGGRLLRSLEKSGADVRSCSLAEGDFCAIMPRSKGVEGTEYAIKTANGIYRVFLPLLGEFQIMNSLEAAAVALMHGVPIARLRGALSNMKAISGRMERAILHDRQSFEVIIDYAHTPDALEKLLHSVYELKKGNGRIVLVFGCGGDREREKRRTMGQIASRLSDMVIVTSDNSRGEDPDEIINEIFRGIDKEKPYALIRDRKEAIELAVSSYVRKGDILVLAGKGHELYQIDANGKHHFDEREIIRATLERLYDS